jgi:hypothetical protein
VPSGRLLYGWACGGRAGSNRTQNSCRDSPQPPLQLAHHFLNNSHSYGPILVTGANSTASSFASQSYTRKGNVWRSSAGKGLVSHSLVSSMQLGWPSTFCVIPIWDSRKSEEVHFETAFPHFTPPHPTPPQRFILMLSRFPVDITAFPINAMAPGMAAASGHGQVALGTKTVTRGSHIRSPQDHSHFNWELHNINWERLNINCVCYCDQNSENNSEYKTLVHMYCCEDSVASGKLLCFCFDPMSNGSRYLFGLQSSQLLSFSTN